MHPLFIKIEASTCICQTEIPGIEGFHILRPYLKSSVPFDATAVEQNLRLWLERRRIGLVTPKIGIIDLDKKRLLTVDILAEQGGQPVFIIIMSTEKRIKCKQKKQLMGYCTGLQKQTSKIFKVSPCVYLVNIYGDGKIYSSCV